MTAASATSGVTMTEKDWSIIQKAYEYERHLKETLKEGKSLRGTRKSKLTAHFHDYSKFIDENANVLARCFGGSEVIDDIRETLRMTMSELGIKLMAA